MRLVRHGIGLATRAWTGPAFSSCARDTLAATRDWQFAHSPITPTAQAVLAEPVVKPEIALDEMNQRIERNADTRQGIIHHARAAVSA